MNAITVARAYAADCHAVANDPGTDDLWLSEDCIAILLDSDCPEGLELRSLLQAVGVQVAMGPVFGLTDDSPLILVHACNRGRADVQMRMDMARHLYPEAPVIFVTGDRAQSTTPGSLDDIRALLRARGIGFVTAAGDRA